MNRKSEKREVKKDYKKIEEYNFKNRKNFTNEHSPSRAEPAPVFIERMLAKWSTLTLEQKIGVVIAILLTIGISAVRMLRNEFHHAGVAGTNFKKQSSDVIPLKREEAFSALRPFIADKWQIDPSLEETHRVAIENGFSRIAQFQYLLTTSTDKKKANFFQENDREDLKLFLKSIAKYKPMVHREEMPADLFEEFSASFKQLSDGRQLAQLAGVDYYIQAIQKHSNIVVMRYTFMKSDKPRDKALAFFADMKTIQAATEAGYKTYSDSDKHFEISSSIQELEPDIQKDFFPEWCDYFTKYHKVPDYCRNDFA